jgi:hypothetical protein
MRLEDAYALQMPSFADKPAYEKEEGKNFYVQWNTSNESFLKTHFILSATGVKNSRFMLSVLDPEVVGLDPHSPFLTNQQKLIIMKECVRNIWYYLREVVRIPIPGGISKFELHIGNLFVIWAISLNLNFFIMLPRQNFKTVSVIAGYSWVYAFATKNTHILLFNKSFNDSKNNLNRLKGILLELPHWMREIVVNEKEDSINAEEIFSVSRSNRVQVKPPGKNKDHADALGRGASVPFINFDEISFISLIKEIYASAGPAMSKAKILAKKNKKPYGISITTTPNAIDSPSGAFAYKIFKGGLQFRLSFYDKTYNEIRNMIDNVAKFDFVVAEYSYQELGLGEEWFNNQRRDLLYDLADIKREVLIQWPISTAASVFSEEQMTALLKYKARLTEFLPIKFEGPIEEIPGYELSFTEMPNLNKQYIVGVDTSTGVGLDYTAFAFRDSSNMRVVGGFKNNTMDEDMTFAVAKYILDFFKYSVMVIERNSLGIVLINSLIKAGYSNRLYYSLKTPQGVKKVANGNKGSSKDIKIQVYGVSTTEGSRDTMFRQLFKMINETPHMLAHPFVQDEIKTLIRKKTTQKIEAQSGHNDDFVMATLLCSYAEVDGDNLQRVLYRNRPSIEDLNPKFHQETIEQPSMDLPENTDISKHSLNSYIDRANDPELQSRVKRSFELSDMISSLNGGDNFNDNYGSNSFF